MFETQPTLLKVLQQAKKNNFFANAYLIVGETATSYLRQIALYLSDDLRIETGNYRDYIEFESDLKKDDVKKLQLLFAKKPVEPFGYNIYAISNIEKASTAALNTLLKFLEEPSTDTIALISTSQKESVLPTILSRCNVIQLDQESPQYSDRALALFELVKDINDLDLMFIKLHQESKSSSYQDYHQLFELLINKYRGNDSLVIALSIAQQQFEKSCNINLVLDHTLYLVKGK